MLFRTGLPIAFRLHVASHKSLAPLEPPLGARELLQARELITKHQPNEMPSAHALSRANAGATGAEAGATSVPLKAR